MTYTVKYKRFNQWFWRTIKDVKGDSLEETMQMRVFILKDETRIEIPFQGTSFEFSNERFIVIQQNMKKETGVAVDVVK
jgi:hypothetical protein